MRKHPSYVFIMYCSPFHAPSDASLVFNELQVMYSIPPSYLPYLPQLFSFPLSTKCFLGKRVHQGRLVFASTYFIRSVYLVVESNGLSFLSYFFAALVLGVCNDAVLPHRARQNAKNEL